MQENNYSHQECMEVLKNLALEIKDMGEGERLITLEDIVRLEAEGKGNRFWLLIIKYLLVKPEGLSKALNLAEEELTPPSNLRHLPVNPENLAQPVDFFANADAFSAFKKLFV